ncbi:hypothetical protein FPV67DRAFT_760302 [Lyophyllum atratum]|nr:hypothetical protein FPV67DRAFT_760302 [Lyophyllum atratum]
MHLLPLLVHPRLTAELRAVSWAILNLGILTISNVHALVLVPGSAERWWAESSLVAVAAGTTQRSTLSQCRLRLT